MNIFYIIGLLLAIFVYIIVIIVYMNNRKESKVLNLLIQESKVSNIKMFNFEAKFVYKFQLKEEDKIKRILYLERTVIAVIIGVFAYYFRGLAVAGIGAIFFSILIEDMTKKVIYDSGITNIGKVTNFINFFVPHINSGHSADQSFLEYIKYAGDEDMSNYWENKHNPDYKIPIHLRQIIDIYDIAKFNEEKGISDYTYIMNELSQDMSQKQTYYNSFISRMGEIKPIMWSYYIGVPLLIAISYRQTSSFWSGFGGYIISLLLLLLYVIFKFLIFKLQKKTIINIF